MTNLICPFCEKIHKHKILGKENDGIKIKCGYCKREWIESRNKSRNNSKNKSK